MEFFGYETCDILIWTSGEGWRNTNTIVKQDIPKNNMKKTYPSSTLSFFPHISTRVISCQNIWFHTDCNYIHQKWGGCVELYK